MKFCLRKKPYSIFIYTFCLSLLFTGICSCSSNIKNIKAENTGENIVSQLNENKKMITLLEEEIQRIKNYNMKYLQLINSEKSYNQEPLTLKHKYNQNETLIKKYILLIKRYQSEIRVMERKYLNSL